jgi:type 1 glutamine amidotransferase
MPTPRRSFLLALAVLIPALLPAAESSSAAKKVLFFSKSADFEHDAIKAKMKNGQPGYAFAVMQKLGSDNNIEFVFSKDGSLFNPSYLAQFDGFCFYTTGDLTRTKTGARGDGNPAMSPAGKEALLQAVAGGKGFVGIHSSTDTFHSHGAAAPARGDRYQNDGDQTDPYIKMIGAEFIAHGAQQPAHLIVADSKFPGISAVPADFGPLEEWYTLKNFAPNLHVLLVQDTSGMKGPNYARPPYPSTWARMDGRGRVFYTSMGHREDIWTSAVFQAVLVGGLNWSLGRVDADVTPNLPQVAPEAGVLQKNASAK